MGAVIINVMSVRSNQITINFVMLIGISVDRIQGIAAEKNNMDETETTAMMNLVTRGASTTRSACRNISAIPIAEAFAAKNGSGICNAQVKG
jgi:hypothetical protein